MKKCNEHCIPSCDFCKSYRDEGLEGNKEFAGIGMCEVDDTEVCASDFCDNFHCFSADEDKE